MRLKELSIFSCFIIVIALSVCLAFRFLEKDRKFMSTDEFIHGNQKVLDGYDAASGVPVAPGHLAH